MIVVLGESLFDVLDHGDGDLRHLVGGSPLNVAVGVARLGESATLATTLAADARGKIIRTYLANSGVQLIDLSLSEKLSNIAMARLDDAGIASYNFRLTWNPSHVPSLDVTAVALHTGSLATALQPGASLVIEALRAERARGQVTLTYDPNIRPSALGPRRTVVPNVEAIIGLVDIVKASDEDIAWLYPDLTSEEVAEKWLKLGPAIVVITRGADGAFAVTGNASVAIPAHDTRIVDTIGAGDSFMAGLLYTLARLNLLGGRRREALGAIDHDTVELLLQRANEVSAITVGRPGADPPTWAEVSFT